MKTTKALFLIAAIAGGVCGCRKAEVYPETPEIHFKALVMKIDGVDPLGEKMKKANLTFSFTDGDGDLGVRDTFDAASKIYCSWMKKMPDRQYETHVFPGDGVTVLTFDIPYDDNVMNKEEAFSKLLKGDMEVKLDVPYGSSSADMDTVHLEFYIVDRAFNRSNVEVTPDFSIRADSVRIEN
ncbi:MAG: hypothetical protein LBF89_02925 [Bacteroidales bacterium]|jgi:hypothetical protein|nr:hypothetical protein [Bacteroidales bacterium]